MNAGYVADGHNHALCRGQTLVSIDCYDEEGIYSHTLHYETEGTSGT